MIRDNIFVGTACMSPPEDDDAAMQRVAEFGGETLTNLVGLVFLDLRQFRVAMSECGYSIRNRVILGKSRVKTHKLEAIGRDGTEYTMIVTENGPWLLRIDNVAMTKAGAAVDPDNLALMKELEDDK